MYSCNPLIKALNRCKHWHALLTPSNQHHIQFITQTPKDVLGCACVCVCHCAHLPQGGVRMQVCSIPWYTEPRLSFSLKRVLTSKWLNHHPTWLRTYFPIMSNRRQRCKKYMPAFIWYKIGRSSRRKGGYGKKMHKYTYTHLFSNTHQEGSQTAVQQIRSRLFLTGSVNANFTYRALCIGLCSEHKPSTCHKWLKPKTLNLITSVYIVYLF